MKYISLSKNYILRGFRGQPYVLADRTNGNIGLLDKKTFYLLDLCDGQLDMDMVFLTEEQKRRLQELLDKEIVEVSQTPVPLQEIQTYKKTDNYFLKSVHWSITGRCNLRCRHCYMSAPDYKYKDLSTETCRGLIDQMAEANVTSVSITGGEPLVREDIWELLDYLHEKGIAVTQIYTNGMLLNEERLEQFVCRGLSTEFVLSFDGGGGHDWLRGKEGAEEGAVKAIRLLKQYGFRVVIETVVYEKNIGTLLETYELMKELKVECWKTSLTFPAGKWKEQLSRTIEVSELYEVYLRIIEKYMADGAPFAMQLDGFFACRKHDGEHWSSPYKKAVSEAGEVDELCCGTCRVHPYLLPDGTLLPCATMTDTELEADMPNLQKETIREIYRNPDHPMFRVANMRTKEIMEKNGDCAVCEYRLQCQGGCRGMSLIENRGIYGHSQVLCTFFKDGYEMKINQTIERRDTYDCKGSIGETGQRECGCERSVKQNCKAAARGSRKSAP